MTLAAAAEPRENPIQGSGMRLKSAGSAPPLLIAEEVTKRFGSLTVLDAVSLRLEPGTVHALLGENGAGKSTLVKCIMGFYHADGGRVVVGSSAVHIKNPKDAQQHGIMRYIHGTPRLGERRPSVRDTLANYVSGRPKSTKGAQGRAPSRR